MTGIDERLCAVEKCVLVLHGESDKFKIAINNLVMKHQEIVTLREEFESLMSKMKVTDELVKRLMREKKEKQERLG